MTAPAYTICDTDLCRVMTSLRITLPAVLRGARSQGWPYTLQLWDTAGQERFRHTMFGAYFRCVCDNKTQHRSKRAIPSVFIVLVRVSQPASCVLLRSLARGVPLHCALPAEAVRTAFYWRSTSRIAAALTMLSATHPFHAHRARAEIDCTAPLQARSVGGAPVLFGEVNVVR